MTAGQAPILADAIASGECDTLSQAGDDILRVEHIAKRFGPITALRDVSLHLRRGEVLGLLGDNGAGKTTLLCGLYRQDKGTMWLKGKPYQPTGVNDARRHGIDTVYQDLASSTSCRCGATCSCTGRSSIVRCRSSSATGCGERRGRPSTRSGSTFPTSTRRWPAYRVDSVRRSPSPAQSGTSPMCCC